MERRPSGRHYGPPATSPASLEGKLNFIIILSTCGNIDEAETIAEQLVGKHLVACVNIVPAIRSIYWWKDAIQKDQEVLMIIKTAKEKFQQIEETIRSLHSYEVPEIISFPLENGSEGYLKWLADSLTT
jgi:periplasmic divalent cation tolerance protein